eukprot:415270_1
MLARQTVHPSLNVDDGSFSCPEEGSKGCPANGVKYYYKDEPSNVPKKQLIDRIDLGQHGQWKWNGGDFWRSINPDPNAILSTITTNELNTEIKTEWTQSKPTLKIWSVEDRDPSVTVEKTSQAHVNYDNVFDEFGGIAHGRHDASYGGMSGTDRRFIGWNPNVEYHDPTTVSIDYMLLSVAFVLFISICCCVVIAVSFVFGYVTNNRKTESYYETISVPHV